MLFSCSADGVGEESAMNVDTHNNNSCDTARIIPEIIYNFHRRNIIVDARVFNVVQRTTEDVSTS